MRKCLVAPMLVFALLVVQFPAAAGPPAATNAGLRETRVVTASGMPPRPSPARPIPYHRPGRLAKTNNNNWQPALASADAPAQLRNLDVLLADGTMDDPLQGNYRLVNLDQIVVAWGEADNQSIYQETEQASFAITEVLKLDDPQAIAGSKNLLGLARADSKFDVATGDLNGDGQAEQVTAWRNNSDDSKNYLTVGELPGSVGKVTSDPVAISRQSGQIDLFVRGYDDALWYRFYNGSSWAAWQSLGGTLASGPAVASWG
ncbi:MAG: hypothetical protein IT330_14190, partial [Anaerolineae bacterium]|nr:hypothetical protein [Anaerolineae bacterium]